MKSIPKRYVLLGTLWFIFMINMLDRGLTTTLLPLIRNDLGLSLFITGLASSSFFITIIIGNMFGGYLSDKWGGRIILKVITIAFSVVTVFTGMIQNTVHFIAVRLSLGLFEAPDISASLGLISRWFPAKERGRATSLLMTSAVLGGILPVVIAIPLTTYFGDWRPVFYVMIIPGLLAAWAVWKFVYDSPEKALARGRLSQEEYALITEGALASGLPVQASKVDRSVVVQLMKDRNFWFAILLIFAQISLGVGFGLWQSTYLMEGLHFTLSQMGMIAIIPGIFSLLGILLFGYLHDRRPGIGSRWVLLVSFAASAGALFLLSLVESSSQLGLLITGMAMHGFFMTASMVPINIYFQKRYGSGMVATAYGLSNGLAQIGGSFLTPIVAGALIVQTAAGLDFSLVFVLFIGIALAGAVTSLFLTDKPFTVTTHQLSDSRNVSQESVPV
ncbi:MFS transporter [Paenibacillus lutrae]|uniref:MFS transporter n=1 Tax=Paenibacillus lutrae TaxID=2078573 RepID=A0A7X3JXP1_9BACL|nr:MFS transporter [Paenibacillus lutrae]MVO98059.1 MFS transporter [Paenibacillus lutrae]